MSEPIEGGYESFEDFCSRPDPIYPKGRNGMYRCPCCMCFTLSGPGRYDICPVCFWEDDGTTGEHGFSPNYGVTLDEARENYRTIGASKEHDVQYVRKPEPEEIE